MKPLLFAALLNLGLLVTTAHAADEAKKPTPQQTKMAECNKEAGDKKGDERKAFMKTCLADKKKKQQEKMSSCNKDAGDKKGDERKKFMKECLSK